MTTIRFLTRTQKDRTWIVHNLHDAIVGQAFERGGREYHIDARGTVMVLTKLGHWSMIGTGAEVQA